MEKKVKIVAFHSYKGGTGKTTIASNLSAFLAKRGYNVCLLDLDLYDPNLNIYFRKEPEKWINDYLNAKANIDEIMMDLSYLVHKTDNYNNNDISNNDNESLYLFSKNKNKEQLIPLKGKLFIGFGQRYDVDMIKEEEKGGKGEAEELENQKKFSFCSICGERFNIPKFCQKCKDDRKTKLLGNLVLLIEELKSLYKPDYIIIDTLHGINYWSINALAIADICFITTKMNYIHIKGTIKVVDDLFDSFKQYGSQWFILWNKVAGYCSPPVIQTMTENRSYDNISKMYYESDDNNYYDYLSLYPNNNNENSLLFSSDDYNSSSKEQQLSKGYIQTDIENIVSSLSKKIDIKTIERIPCYCDIHFSQREFLTSIQYPFHPFSKKIAALAKSINSLSVKDA